MLLSSSKNNHNDTGQAEKQARAEARALGHRYVGTEHLLLALMRDRDGSPARVLARQGLAFDEARARILWILTADPQNPAPFVAPTAV